MTQDSERKFTVAEKLHEIEYEIEMRHRVYPGRIRDGKMTINKAREKIAIMHAIAQDYREQRHAELDPSARG